jgi:hypothetical protein
MDVPFSPLAKVQQNGEEKQEMSLEDFRTSAKA